MPSEVIITIPIPAPIALEASSINTFHERFSTLQIIFPSFLGVNFAMKSARTCPFTELRGLYLMSKEPSRVPHLAIWPVKSDLLNSDYRGYSVRMNTVRA